jgi:hypothetical protein
MTEILFFRDDAEVAEAGARYSLEVANAGKVQAALKAAEALALSTAAHDRQATIHRCSAGLSDKLTRLKDEHSAKTRVFFENALLDESLDHDGETAQLARYTQPISGLTGALEYYRAVMLPEIRLESLRADEALFGESANLAGWTVLESAVIRHEASRSLADADGIVTFGAVGRTHDLLVASIEAHRRAGEASAMVGREEQQQRAQRELR